MRGQQVRAGQSAILGRLGLKEVSVALQETILHNGRLCRAERGHDEHLG